MLIRISGWRGTGKVPLSINGVLREFALGIEHTVTEAEHEALKAAECVIEVVEGAVEAVEDLVTGEAEAPAEASTETTESSGESAAETDAAQVGEPTATSGDPAPLAEGDADTLAASAA